MAKNSETLGHLTALFTIIIWGTTFISTKILLNDFSPIEILFFRFIVGFMILFLLSPKKIKLENPKQELYFAAAGLCGVTLYFLLENIALTFTFASNVGVIISIAPFFTAILAHFILKNEKLSLNFILGFIASIIGIFLISFNGNSVLKLNPLGDILSVLAAFVWAVYAILTKKINEFKCSIIQSTRKIFSYGLIFMIPVLFIFDFKIDLHRFAEPKNLFNILYLGIGASAVCFATWNLAVKILGAVKTSVYIYVSPLVTLLMSVIILHENITLLALTGTFLTLSGLLISESKIKFKRKEIEIDI